MALSESAETVVIAHPFTGAPTRYLCDNRAAAQPIPGPDSADQKQTRHTWIVFWTRPFWKHVFPIGLALFFVVLAMRATIVVLIAVRQTGSLFFALNVIDTVLTVVFLVMFVFAAIRKIILARSAPPAH
jgi:hypothetical protein